MRSAVIDIGSNSIKLLIAENTDATSVFETIREVRLSPNAESARERISDVAFAAGLASVRDLFQITKTYAPHRISIVGTSLFRTAENANDFALAVEAATGTLMRILSCREEASLVAAGVLTDFRIRPPCAIFDLGGGSLEFISCPGAESDSFFEASWQLGAVRLTRKFFPDTSAPVPAEQIALLRAHVKQTIGEILKTHLPPAAQIVFCGGTAGIFERLLPALTREAIENLLTQTAAVTLAERVALGVPEKRADIFPAGLAIFAEICATGNISSACHSTRNLRYGLCAQLNSQG